MGPRLSTGRRSSSPPVPFGILVKLPTPMRFCSVVKAQWSVATTCSEPEASPAREKKMLVDLVAERRRHHPARRVVPVAIKILALVERQVLDQRLAVDALAQRASAADRLVRRLTGELHDVERHAGSVRRS